MLYFLKWLTIRLKRSEKLGFPKIFFNRVYINQISIDFRIKNTLSQKFLQTVMIFFDQFIESMVKFGKTLWEFIIPTAVTPCKELVGYEFDTTIEFNSIALAKRIS